MKLNPLQVFKIGGGVVHKAKISEVEKDHYKHGPLRGRGSVQLLYYYYDSAVSSPSYMFLHGYHC